MRWMPLSGVLAATCPSEAFACSLQSRFRMEILMSELVGVLGSSTGQATTAGGRPAVLATLTIALARFNNRTTLESWLAPERNNNSHPKTGRKWLRAMLAEATIG